jgi:hypothetical protein
MPQDARRPRRGCLESYLTAPYAVYEACGQAIHDRLRGWGEVLFEAPFGADKPGRDLYLPAREGQAELVLTSRSPGFLGLPWELLKDPQRDTPLAMAAHTVRVCVVEDTNRRSLPHNRPESGNVGQSVLARQATMADDDSDYPTIGLGIRGRAKSASAVCY